LAKGYTEEEAKEQLSKRQRTFDLNYCIKKYGLEEGTKRFNDRQNKWLNSFKKSIKNASKNGIASSNIANNFFNIVESIINGGEREVIKGKYSFDFIFKNKIIEFNGDYWHMNPKIYDEKCVNKTINMTAREVWDRDKKKLKYAKNHNYDMYVVWESDYKNNPDETLKKCIKFLTS
jgi:hypothetical protein